MVATHDYDAFGNILAESTPVGGGGQPWPFEHRAFGELFDRDLGMVFLRARWMDPSDGRFISRDPFGGSSGDPQSLHRYTYAHADPINKIDPSGEFTLIEVLLVTVILTGLAIIADQIVRNIDFKRIRGNVQTQRRNALRAEARNLATPDEDDCAAFIQLVGFAIRSTRQSQEFVERVRREIGAVPESEYQAESAIVMGDLFAVLIGEGAVLQEERGTGPAYYGALFGTRGFRPEFTDPSQGSDQVAHSFAAIYYGWVTRNRTVAEAMNLINEHPFADGANQEDRNLFRESAAIGEGIWDSNLDTLGEQIRTRLCAP